MLMKTIYTILMSAAAITAIKTFGMHRNCQQRPLPNINALP